jgi:hypothetical protein
MHYPLLPLFGVLEQIKVCSLHRLQQNIYVSDMINDMRINTGYFLLYFITTNGRSQTLILMRIFSSTTHRVGTMEGKALEGRQQCIVSPFGS